MYMEVLHISCNMYTNDLPDMYALRLWAYISGKSLVPMLQLLYVYIYLFVYFKSFLLQARLALEVYGQHVPTAKNMHTRIIIQLQLTYLLLQFITYVII